MGCSHGRESRYETDALDNLSSLQKKPCTSVHIYGTSWCGEQIKSMLVTQLSKEGQMRQTGQI